MLVFDELDELVRADTSLVAKGEAFREQFDEPKLKRVSNEPVISTFAMAQETVYGSLR